MKSQEVSERTGLPISTLRFYERKQLIPEAYISRDEQNYRDYHEEILPFLEDLKALLAVGFSVQELRALLYDNEDSPQEKRNTVISKIKQIEQLAAQMEASKAFLVKVLEGKVDFQHRCEHERV